MGLRNAQFNGFLSAALIANVREFTQASWTAGS
jgi:hypothetical protein